MVLDSKTARSTGQHRTAQTSAASRDPLAVVVPRQRRPTLLKAGIERR
jgi:hypothetical protein